MAAARADTCSSKNGSLETHDGNSTLETPGLDPRSPDVLLGDGLGPQPGQGMCPAEQLSRWPGATAFQPVR